MRKPHVSLSQQSKTPPIIRVDCVVDGCESSAIDGSNQWLVDLLLMKSWFWVLCAFWWASFGEDSINIGLIRLIWSRPRWHTWRYRAHASEHSGTSSSLCQPQVIAGQFVSVQTWESHLWFHSQRLYFETASFAIVVISILFYIYHILWKSHK